MSRQGWLRVVQQLRRAWALCYAVYMSPYTVYVNVMQYTLAHIQYKYMLCSIHGNIYSIRKCYAVYIGPYTVYVYAMQYTWAHIQYMYMLFRIHVPIYSICICYAVYMGSYTVYVYVMPYTWAHIRYKHMVCKFCAVTQNTSVLYLDRERSRAYTLIECGHERTS